MNYNYAILAEQLAKMRHKAMLLDASNFEEVDQWHNKFFKQLKMLRNISWVNEELARICILEKVEMKNGCIENPVKTEYRIKDACRLIDRIIRYLDRCEHSATSTQRFNSYRKRKRGNSLTSALHNARKSAKH